ncbi:hypothetical protein B0I26_1101, partial [Anoxybacillus vitaminiphilus]
ASSAQQISAGTQELSAAVEEQVNTARHLDTSANILQKMAKSFRGSYKKIYC